MNHLKVQKKSTTAKRREKELAYNPMKKIKFRFDRSILNMFIGYIYSKNKLISKMNLSNLYKLLDMTDERIYDVNRELSTRLTFAKKSLEAILMKGMVNQDSIISFARESNNEVCDKIIEELPHYQQLNDDEVKFIAKSISDRLQYCFIITYKEIINNVFLRIDTGDYKYLEDIIGEVKDDCTSLMNEIRKADMKKANETFSLEPDVFESLVTETVQEATNPSSILYTGLQTLNLMLSPGYMPGRLYLYLGITGGFKSAMLLSTCYWIKKYNRVMPSSPGKRPTILYISNENTIHESIIRLFNMSSSVKDITEYTPEKAISLMREKGGLNLKTDDDIDIVMQYYGNFEISTADVYSIIEDLEDQNREVICFVLDYIKRIRPAQKAMDERSQLANVSNELKDLAIRKQIPVITAQQINRAGNMTVDSALESGKEDLARFLGRGNIAQSWDMLENCDWTAILNVEIERSSGIRYLTIKEIKKRYKSLTDITYMNQPFMEGSTIQLVEDFGQKTSAAKLSLATDMIGVNTKAEKKHDLEHKKGMNPFGDDKNKIDINQDFEFSNELG